MVRRSLLSLLGSLVLAGVLTSCSSSSGDSGMTPPGGAATSGQALPPPAGHDLIRAGDPLTIQFADIPEPRSSQLVVREDGTISLQFGVVVQAAGRTKSQLEEEIHRQYVPRYYVRLKVTVETGERQIYVGGAVRIPNGYPHSGDLTVLKAVKLAGDFNEFANRKKVRLTRANGTKITVDCRKAELDPALDLPVFPGDKIEVPKKMF